MTCCSAPGCSVHVRSPGRSGITMQLRSGLRSVSSCQKRHIFRSAVIQNPGIIFSPSVIVKLPLSYSQHKERLTVAVCYSCRHHANTLLFWSDTNLCFNVTQHLLKITSILEVVMTTRCTKILQFKGCRLVLLEGVHNVQFREHIEIKTRLWTHLFVL